MERELTEQDLQDFRDHADEYLIVFKADFSSARKIFRLISEIERLQDVNKKWRDHDWECMQKLIRAEKAFEDIVNMPANEDYVSEIARQALADIR